MGNEIKDDARPLASTRRKLREATFFFRHLETEDSRIFLYETRSEASEFFLSTFLSAGRSVGDYITTEGGAEYAAWWARRNTPQEHLDLLGFTRAQRVKSVHIRGPAIERTEEWVPVALLHAELAAGGGSFVSFSTAPQTSSAARVRRTVIRFVRFPERRVVDVCRDYLDLMNTVVNEYEAMACPPPLHLGVKSAAD